MSTYRIRFFRMQWLMFAIRKKFHRRIVCVMAPLAVLRDET